MTSYWTIQLKTAVERVPHYWGSDGNGGLTFTPNLEHAIRLARRQDAEWIIRSSDWQIAEPKLFSEALDI